MEFTKMREYIGDLNQLFSVREYVLEGGKKQGVHGIDVNNGTGLEVTILPDRCMDIYQIKFKGRGLNYLTQAGITAPAYYDNQGGGWLRSFSAGFLTTCGINNIGNDCEVEGEKFGLHGSIGNTPAEHVNIERFCEKGIPGVRISGTMRCAALFADCLTLTRTFTIQYGCNEVHIKDQIENTGFKKSPYMMLYHFNMGYPLLSEDAKFQIPTTKVTPRNEHAEKYVDEYQKITPPADDYEEMCYYHELKADSEGTATVGIHNEKEKLGLTISFNKDELDHFVQWKMLGKGEYVTGLEPCNATIGGRAEAERDGTIKWIDGGGYKEHRLKISVFE